MAPVIQKVPICTNCTNNSAQPDQWEVHCYWKEHEGLDPGTTCKYFDRGIAETIVPVNHCFKFYTASDVLYIVPQYGVSFVGHGYPPHTGGKLWSDEDEERKGSPLYDAGIDLLGEDPFVHQTLKDFLTEHIQITTHRTITDAMAQRYPAMGAARRMIEQRSKK